MKINKKVVAVILIIAVVAAIAIGCSVMGGDKKENTEDVAKHNQQVLDDLTDDKDDESDKDSKDKDKDKDITGADIKDATYEQWMAAASVTAISLTYPDFEIDSILAASDTDFGDREDSKGIYVIFTSGGKKYAVFSKPLKEERSDKGTVDLYGQEIGFTTFDMVEPGEIDTKKMKEIKVDDLNQLISKSTLISLYEHY